MRKKILVVDDRGELRKLVTMTFAYGNFEFEEAANGEDAIDVANTFKPDLVILDVMMPGRLNGFDVCKILRTLPELSETKIVMLTARGQENDREVGKTCGADAYVVKPFSPLNLMQTVTDVLAPSGEKMAVSGHD